MLILSFIQNLNKDRLVRKKKGTLTAYLIDMALASMIFREHQRQHNCTVRNEIKLELQQNDQI